MASEALAAGAAAAAGASPEGRPVLRVGDYVEIRLERDQPDWAALQVLEAHGNHRYTLGMPADDFPSHIVVEDTAEGGADAAAAAGPRLSATVVSECALVVEDEGEESTHEWRPATDCAEEFFGRALQRMAEQSEAQGLPSLRGTGWGDRALEQGKAEMAALLRAVVTRATQLADQEGTQVVSVENVTAALAAFRGSVAFPLPPAEEPPRRRVRPRRQRE